MLNKFVFTSIIFAVIFFPSYAYAHPIDEIDNVNVYDQKQTLILSPTKTILKIDLTFYAFEKMKVWNSVNQDKDQNLTQKEKDSWMKLGSSSSWLEKEGKQYAFTPISASLPNYDEFFSSKPIDISLELTSDIRIETGDKVSYIYKGKDRKLESITLEVQSISGIKPSEMEKNSSDSVSFTILEGPQDTSSTFVPIGTSDRLNQFLNKYVKVQSLPLGLLLTSVVVSFLIGMLHALTPGHGKAIVAGYLVGEKGTISHAINLGLIITITHTASVFILGLTALLLTEYIVPEQIIKWMSLVSGVLIAAFGIYLIIKRIGKFSKQFKHSHSHSDFDEVVHGHGHKHDFDNTNLTWKNLLPLGISGGLVPCIDALAILIVAISLGKILLGITLLVAFSAGLAFALIIGGIIVVFAKNKALSKVSKLEKFEKYSSLASAIVVTILGLALILGQPI